MLYKPQQHWNHDHDKWHHEKPRLVGHNRNIMYSKPYRGQEQKPFLKKIWQGSEIIKDDQWNNPIGTD